MTIRIHSLFKIDNLVVVDAVARVGSVLDEAPFTSRSLTWSLVVGSLVAHSMSNVEASRVAHLEAGADGSVADIV